MMGPKKMSISNDFPDIVHMISQKEEIPCLVHMFNISRFVK